MGWDDVNEGGGTTLKIKAGTPAKIHIINAADGPKSFHSVYFEAVNRGAIVDKDNNPLDGLGDEYKLRKRHAFVVFDHADQEVKTFVCSNQVANAIKAINDEFGSLDDLDLKITRTGDGLNTKYQVLNIPKKFNDDMIDGKELPDLEEIFKITPDEDIEKLRSGELPDNAPPLEDDETPAPAKAAPAKAKGKAAPAPKEEEETPAEEEGPGTASEEEGPADAGEEEPAKPAAPAANTRAGMLAIIKGNFTKMARYKNPKQQMVDIQYFGGKKAMALSQLTTEQLTKLIEYQKKQK